jgi:hypothetical protein
MDTHTTPDGRTFSVGQLVEFHCQWPHKIVVGRILKIEERPRDLGAGTEVGAVCAMRDHYHDVGTPERYTTFVPFWNHRFQPARGRPDSWFYQGITLEPKCAHPAGCELPPAPGDIYCAGCRTAVDREDADNADRGERATFPPYDC